MAVSAPRVGTPVIVTGNNPAAVPIPAGSTTGDALIIISQNVRLSTSGTITTPGTPANWMRKDTAAVTGLSGQLRSTQFYLPDGWVSGMATPSLSYSGGLSTDQHRAQMFALPGAETAGDPTDVISVATLGAQSSNTLGPFPGPVAAAADGGIAFVFAAADNDGFADSVFALLTGDSLTWVEADDWVGQGAASTSFVIDYALIPTGRAITAKSFTVTNGYSSPVRSIGRIWVIKAAADEPPDPDPEGLIWSADFEGSDVEDEGESGLPEMSDNNAGDHAGLNTIGLSTTRVLFGTQSLRAQVVQQASGMQRAELETGCPDFEDGDERWEAFSLFLEPGFPTATDSWQVCHQWKNRGDGSPPMELSIEDGRFRLTGGYGHPDGDPGDFSMPPQDLGPATTGVRIDFLCHIIYHSDPDIGEISVLRNGVMLLDSYQPPGGTKYEGADTYLKFGIYRDPATAELTNVICTYDRLRVGTTRESVELVTARPVGQFLPFFG